MKAGRGSLPGTFRDHSEEPDMRLNPTPLALALATGLLLSACSQDSGSQNNEAPADAVAAATDASTPPADAAADEAAARNAQADPIDAVLAGDWRDPANAPRDAWRHPRETLAFFGVGPSQRIVEISPGGGWYTEILAPLAQGQGQLCRRHQRSGRGRQRTRRRLLHREQPEAARQARRARRCLRFRHPGRDRPEGAGDRRAGFGRRRADLPQRPQLGR